MFKRAEQSKIREQGNKQENGSNDYANARIRT